MEQKKRILIADGSAKFCDELTQALVKCSEFEIAGTVNDGEQAIKLVKKTEPDVLVLDMMLPKKDGLEVLKSFANIDIAKRPVVIAVSQFMTEYVASAAANLGVRYLMLKPLAVNDLIEKIQEYTAVKPQVTSQEMEDQMECQIFDIKEEFLLEEANSGNVDAMLMLGKLHHHSDIGDFEKAFEWFQKAANAGCADAYFYIGAFYEHPQGLLVVEPSDEKAVEYYLKAVELGSTNAMYRMGDRYYQGWLSTPKDTEKGLALIEQAAQLGNHEALFWLSIGEKDPQKALRYAQKAYQKLQDEQWGFNKIN